MASENPAEYTVEFSVPAQRGSDWKGRGHELVMTWIHPAFNEQFCHYYSEQSGDLPNSYVKVEIDDVGDDWLEFDSVGELSAWLAELAAAAGDAQPR